VSARDARARAARSARPARPRSSVASPEASLARSENSLYLSIQAVKRKHKLERLGIALYDSETRMQWSYNGDAYFHAASTMKLAVLVGVFRQVFRKELELDAPIHVRNRFTSLIENEPFSLDLDRDASPEVAAHLGRTMSVKDLAYQMITTSSNLATNLLIDVVTIGVIQKALDELRVQGIEVLRGVEDQKAFAAGKNNMVTAHGLLRLLRLISDGRVYSPEISAELLEILLDQRHKSGIPAGLPGGAQVAHKTGNISTVHHDAGIVYIGKRRPYAAVILTQSAAGVGSSTAVAEVSRQIYSALASLSQSELDRREPGGQAG
jgi:beta-lactamase class A